MDRRLIGKMAVDIKLSQIIIFYGIPASMLFTGSCVL